ncbi:MAG: hypothetical protein RLZZ347_833 [Candidatus Parcubacteria bacterium]|jgi:hypothetical protein
MQTTILRKEVSNRNVFFALLSLFVVSLFTSSDGITPTLCYMGAGGFGFLCFPNWKADWQNYMADDGRPINKLVIGLKLGYMVMVSLLGGIFFLFVAVFFPKLLSFPFLENFRRQSG